MSTIQAWSMMPEGGPGKGFHHALSSAAGVAAPCPSPSSLLSGSRLQQQRREELWQAGRPVSSKALHPHQLASTREGGATDRPSSRTSSYSISKKMSATTTSRPADRTPKPPPEQHASSTLASVAAG